MSIFVYNGYVCWTTFHHSIRMIAIALCMGLYIQNTHVFTYILHIHRHTDAQLYNIYAENSGTFIELYISKFSTASRILGVFVLYELVMQYTACGTCVCTFITYFGKPCGIDLFHSLFQISHDQNNVCPCTLTGLPWKRIGDMSTPSSTKPARGAADPVKLSIVGRRSTVAASCIQIRKHRTVSNISR